MIEPVRKLASHSSFKPDAIVKCKKKAIKEVRKDQPGLVFWMDGSKLSYLDPGHVAAALC